MTPAFMETFLYATGLRPTRRRALPHFLGIGAQKAGTSWLHENLRRHPELFLPQPKELHFFDLEFHRSLAWYESHFAPAGGRRCGEITPSYGILPPQRIRFIRRIMPDVRLILLLRNPIDRAWSQALMNLVHQPKRALDAVQDSEFIDHFRQERSLSRGDYLRMLDNWLAHFPQEQLFVGWYEDIRHRPAGLLAEVFRHIGVKEPADWSAYPLDRVFFPGPAGTPPPPRLREVLEALYAGRIEALHRRLGQRVEPWRVGLPAQTGTGGIA